MPAVSAPAPEPAAGNCPVPPRRDTLRYIALAEGTAITVATLLVVYLHVHFRQMAGGLWRDEANSIAVASLPSFADTWANLQFDSFPILFFVILRGLAAVFSPDNDAALRTYGLLVGLGIIGALWLNARLFKSRWPVVSLALLGFNPLFIRYGDSMRAYGLGILLLLLTFGAVWRVVESAQPRRWLLAALAAVLSVQALYYNSVLLFAICTAGALTAARERDWKKAAAILGIGAVSALSLLPYMGTIHRLREWNFLVQMPMSLPWMWRTLCDVIGAPDPLGIRVWTPLFLGALALAGWRMFSRRETEAPAPAANRAEWFAGSCLTIGAGCYLAFLKTLNYYTQPWYFIAFLAFAAVCMDVLYGRFAAGAATGWRRLAPVFLLVVFGALTFLQTVENLRERQTNVDLIAGQLSQMAAKDDLILHARWECAITFDRYYRGQTPQMTLPPLDDHRFHRYDLVKAQMMAVEPLAPVWTKISETLRAGHKVWVVGGLLFGRPGGIPPQLPPAWMGPDGRWHGGPYYAVWQAQAGHFLSLHAAAGSRIGVVARQPIRDYENLSLSVFEGWKPDADAPH
jgi:hypothetical protein